MADGADKAVTDEQRRLRELYALKVLDTEPEERFDRFTGLVADILEVPYCFITLIDEHRHWVKSAHGWGREEGSRLDSFCGHVLDNGYLEVPDALEDSRFVEIPAVTGPMGARFYAGTLLRSSSGEGLGCLCILDQETRTLETQDKRRLQEFARLIEQELFFDERISRVRQELTAVALHDPVTGLPGQLVAEERLDELLARNRRQQHFATVVRLTFPRYDELIAAYGVEETDRVARLMATRIRSRTEGRGLAARPSPDSVLAMAGGFDSQAAVDQWVAGLYDSVTNPYVINRGQRNPDVTAGVSVLPVDAHSAAEMIRHTALALRQSGVSGGMNYYSGEKREDVVRRDHIIGRLTRALEREEIRLAFQPVFRVSDGQPYTCEALARWDDQELGEVSPEEFIPLAEADPRLSCQLSRLVLRQACMAAVEWNRERKYPVAVNVNLAGPEFHRPGLAEEIMTLLETTGLAPSLLVIELTESTVIGDIMAAADTVRQLRDLGVSCALDDFGTGYSSLSYLRRIPFATLKVDRSFICDMPGDDAATAVTRCIINIGKTLGMNVIAEGVETEAQRLQLRNMGCDNMQGYLLSRPLYFREVHQLLYRYAKGGRLEMRR